MAGPPAVRSPGRSGPFTGVLCGQNPAYEFVGMQEPAGDQQC